MIKKNLYLLFLATTCFYSAQKVSNKKTSSDAVVVEMKASSTTKETYVMSAPREKSKEITILTGKPQVFLVNIREHSESCNSSEELELNNNFGVGNLQITNICRYTDLMFPDQTLKLKDEGSSIIFWSGKAEDKYATLNGYSHATEFVAKQMGMEKESSYAIKTKKWKKEIAELEKIQKVSSKSKEIMTAILNNLSSKSLIFQDSERLLFNIDIPKIKIVENYYDQENKKIMIAKITFREDGLVNSIQDFDRKGNPEKITNFKYKDGLLIETIKGNEKTLYSYHDDKIVATTEEDSRKAISVYRLENGKLLRNFYSIMTGDKQEFNNYLSKMTLENNCIKTENQSVDYFCTTPPNKFPYITTYKMTYGQNEMLRRMKYEKINDFLLKVFATDRDDDEHYILAGEIKLNEKKLIESYKMFNGNTESIIIYDYTFYP